MMKRLTAVVMVLAMLLCSVAALAEDAGGEDPVLVTVNGQEIRETNDILQFWFYYLMENSGVDDDSYIPVIRQYAMDYTIQYIALEAKLAEAGKGLTEEEEAAFLADAKADWDDAVAYIMEMQFGITEESSEEDREAAKADTIEYILTYYGYTEDVYVSEVATQAKLIEETNRAADMVSDGIEVTDEEIEAYFNEMVQESKDMIGEDAGMYEFYQYYYGYESLYTPAGYRGITHILLKVEDELLQAWQDLLARLEEQAEGETEGTDETETDPDAATETEEPVTQEMVDAAKQAILDSVKDKIAEIQDKLANNVDFEDLIIEYGEDPGMEDEATRKAGYPVHKDSIVWDSNFAAAAMALENVGDISDPIVSNNGVHILKYLRDIPGGAAELTEERRADLMESMKTDKINEAITALMEQATADAEIVWTEAGEPWKLATEGTGEEAGETEEVPAE